MINDCSCIYFFEQGEKCGYDYLTKYYFYQRLINILDKQIKDKQCKNLLFVIHDFHDRETYRNMKLNGGIKKFINLISRETHLFYIHSEYFTTFKYDLFLSPLINSLEIEKPVLEPPFMFSLRISRKGNCKIAFSKVNLMEKIDETIEDIKQHLRGSKLKNEHGKDLKDYFIEISVEQIRDRMETMINDKEQYPYIAI